MKDNKIDLYISSLLEQSPDWAKQLEEYAMEQNVPIMEPAGIAFLQQLIRIKQPKKILEIGTAIGYSALQMVHAYPESKVLTIERDQVRFDQAKENIKRVGFEQQIELIFGDALETEGQALNHAPFDLLFIDAAKGQYQKFFELYTPMLTEDAVIVTDNVLFKGFVAEPNQENKRIQKIADKISKYNHWIANQKNYHTIILPIGDGIAITTKRK